jgi:hypothetical protein
MRFYIVERNRPTHAARVLIIFGEENASDALSREKELLSAIRTACMSSCSNLAKTMSVIVPSDVCLYRGGPFLAPYLILD